MSDEVFTHINTLFDIRVFKKVSRPEYSELCFNVRVHGHVHVYILSCVLVHVHFHVNVHAHVHLDIGRFDIKAIYRNEMKTFCFSQMFLY